MLSTIIALHFLFDWIFQSREVAKTKKTSNLSLFQHSMDILLFLLLTCWLFNLSTTFFLINFCSHVLIDKFLPSGTTEREMINWTAIDQILHLVILINTIHL